MIKPWWWEEESLFLVDSLQLSSFYTQVHDLTVLIAHTDYKVINYNCNYSDIINCNLITEESITNYHYNNPVIFSYCAHSQLIVLPLPPPPPPPPPSLSFSTLAVAFL